MEVQFDRQAQRLIQSQEEAIVRAVRAAAERSRELGDELGKD